MNKTIDYYNFALLVDCHVSIYIGIYLTILSVLCLSTNGTLVYLFIKNKVLRTPINGLLMTIIVLNLVASVTELPLVSFSSYNCRYTYGVVGCNMEAFLLYYVGCNDNYLLAVLSFERYWVIHKPLSIRNLSFKVCSIAICLCSTLSFIWAISPIIGWSRYTLEGIGVSCSIDWCDDSWNSKSYIFAVFLFVYICPLLILIVASVKLIQKVKRSKKFLQKNVANQNCKNKFSKEMLLTITIILSIISFIISWTPYALVTAYSVFFDDSAISPMLATIPSLFAKSALLWPGLIQIMLNKEVKKCLLPNRSIAPIGTIIDNTRTNM